MGTVGFPVGSRCETENSLSALHFGDDYSGSLTDLIQRSTAQLMCCCRNTSRAAATAAAGGWGPNGPCWSHRTRGHVVPIFGRMCVRQMSSRTLSFRPPHSMAVEMCKECTKRVYPTERVRFSPRCLLGQPILNALQIAVDDGVVYHKTCLKCTECSRTLSLGNFTAAPNGKMCARAVARFVAFLKHARQVLQAALHPAVQIQGQLQRRLRRGATQKEMAEQRRCGREC
jgi:hypothetical protein